MKKFILMIMFAIVSNISLAQEQSSNQNSEVETKMEEVFQDESTACYTLGIEENASKQKSFFKPDIFIEINRGNGRLFTRSGGFLYEQDFISEQMSRTDIYKPSSVYNNGNRGIYISFDEYAKINLVDEDADNQYASLETQEYFDISNARYQVFKSIRENMNNENTEDADQTFLKCAETLMTSIY